jgi:hypothetical protein
MVHFTALTFFPCYGRLPLSGAFLYLDDTLAALYFCHATGLCASLVSRKDPAEVRVWVFSFLWFSGFQAKAGKQPDFSCTHLCKSRRSGYALVLQSPSTWSEVTPILPYPGQTLRASPQRLIAAMCSVSIAVPTRESILESHCSHGRVSTLALDRSRGLSIHYTNDDVMWGRYLRLASFTPRFNQSVGACVPACIKPRGEPYPHFFALL